MEAFCKYFAEEKPRNSFSEIEKKRKKIMELVEKRVGVRVTVANIQKLMEQNDYELIMFIIEKIEDVEKMLNIKFLTTVMTVCEDIICA